jgi:hypothetical protein
MDSVDEGLLRDQHRNRCVSYTAFVGHLVDPQDKMLAFGARASQSIIAGKRSRRWPRKRNSVIINQFYYSSICSGLWKPCSLAPGNSMELSFGPWNLFASADVACDVFTVAKNVRFI